MIPIEISLPESSQFTNLNNWTLTGFFAAVINLIIVVAVVSSIINFFLGGFLYILSGGDKEKMHQATRRITGAFVGLLIVLSTYMIVNFLSNFLGVDLLYFRIIGVTG